MTFGTLAYCADMNGNSVPFGLQTLVYFNYLRRSSKQELILSLNEDLVLFKKQQQHFITEKHKRYKNNSKQFKMFQQFKVMHELLLGDSDPLSADAPELPSGSRGSLTSPPDTSSTMMHNSGVKTTVISIYFTTDCKTADTDLIWKRCE